MKTAALPLLVLALASTGLAQKIGEVERHSPDPKAPREKTLEWTSESGQPFWYRLPKEIHDRNPPSLIFLLHGTGMNHGWGFWNYGVDSGAFRPKDIVVSPEGCTEGAGGTFNFVQGKRDGDQIRSLILAFRKQFPVGNVYLYGHSQGAFFCYWFAGEYPELVNGIVAHAGNVLAVQHPNLAKERIAIAILHAESDQVVSVEAAYRAEKIYREAGYKKLKLRIVEGIRPEAGHWPLPGEVLALLEWCDRVSVATAGHAIEIAEAEIAKESADVRIVAESTARARELVKRERGPGKQDLESRLKRIERWNRFVAEAAAGHLAESAGQQDPKAGYGEWCFIYREACQILDGEQVLKRSLNRLHPRAERESRQTEQAAKKLERAGFRGFREGLKIWMETPAASNAASLEQQLQSLVRGAGTGVVPEDSELFQRELGARKEMDSKARPIWQDLLRTATAKLDAGS